MPKSNHDAQYLVRKTLLLREKYLNPHLIFLALHKLHCTLDFCLNLGCLRSEERAQAAVSLIAYALSSDNTPDCGVDGQIESLRQEVLEFTVIKMENLQNASDFETLQAG